MGRKKILMNFIEDDRKRASTFEKRRIGLFKKASELNRLCGVNISVMIVNKDLVYKFSDKSESYFKNYLNEKIEEDFNNDSLSEFINKKSQKNPYTNDNNSNEHQSLEEEPCSALTDDEEDPKFLDVLVKHHLLDHYNNIDPDVSPVKENIDSLQTTDQNKSDQIVNSSGLMSFNFPANNQCNGQLASKISIPSINEIRMNHQSQRSEESNAIIKQEHNSYSELVTMSTINSSYPYNIDNSLNSISDCNWQMSLYGYHNLQDTELHFDNNTKYQNSLNFETPTYEIHDNVTMHHLNNGLPLNFQDEQEGPNVKRIKRFFDSRNTSYFQQPSS